MLGGDAYLMNRGSEELLPRVDLIHLALDELFLKRTLQRRCVLAPNESVNVERKRNARVTELADTVERLEPARQPDLVDVFSKRAHVRDHVHVSRLGLLSHR